MGFLAETTRETTEVHIQAEIYAAGQASFRPTAAGGGQARKKVSLNRTDHEARNLAAA